MARNTTLNISCCLHGWKILVVNPNSSQSITDSVTALFGPSEGELEFMTGPPSSPKAIDNEEDAMKSAVATLPKIIERMNEPNSPSAVLVACYSDHPLVKMLEKEIDRPDFQVLGILDASVISAVKHIKPGEKFGIVTTGKQWEPLLTDGALRVLDEMDDEAEPDCLAGVVGTGLGVLEFHDEEKDPKKLMAEAAKELVAKGATAICLGCAGMSGLDAVISEAVNEKDMPERVVVIDGVKAGVEILRSRLSQSQ